MRGVALKIIRSHYDDSEDNWDMNSLKNCDGRGPEASRIKIFSRQHFFSRTMSCFVAFCLSGCATAPPGPASVAQTDSGQTLDSQGNFVVEHSGQYALLVGKMDNPTGTVAALTQAGEPIAVTFLNLSSTPMNFGPDNISIQMDDGSSADLLKPDQISDLESGKKISDRIGEAFSVLGMLAGAAAVGMGEGSGQISSVQADQDANMLGSATNDAVQSADADVDNINSQNAALQAASNGLILAPQSVSPGIYNAGVIVIRKLNPASTFTITVKVNGVTDKFHYDAAGKTLNSTPA